jgi:two-component system, cell cycle sensor histidine kinase and response regulator CckA
VSGSRSAGSPRGARGSRSRRGSVAELEAELTAARREAAGLQARVDSLDQSLQDAEAANRALTLAMVTDITERRQAEATRAQLAASTIARDVSERRRAEEEHRRSEERFRTIFRASPAAIGIGHGGVVLDANDRYCEFFGYRRDELIGRSVKKLGLWVDLADRERMMTIVREQRSVRDFETSFRRKNGETRVALLSVEAIELMDEDDLVGEEPVILVMVQDVTERRRLEEQLRHSQKMESIGRLAGGVAHDFNNLLTVILGYCELLATRFERQPRAQREMQEIRHAAERAASLTRQLLAFSRKQILMPEVLNLGRVVHELSSLVERLIGEDVEVSLSIAPDLGLVAADPGQMEQVLMNLAVNARDAMPEGGKLLFELTNVDIDEACSSQHLDLRPGSYVMLAVADSGVGMTPEVRKRIFDPFFTTKEAGKGTGLGLSTVHGIVNQSGGSIWVYSEPGRGTTFKIYLPRVAGTPDASSEQADSDSTSSPQASATILLAEDDDQLRLLARRTLELAGYTVLDASDPLAAQQLLETHDDAIDLLITDVVMPGLSGPELASSPAARRSRTRVLYMSGYTDDAIVHHGILKSGTHFLQKPFTPHHLLRRVREVLGTEDQPAAPVVST